MLQALFSQSPQKPFLVTEEKTYSYQWLQENIKKTSGLFDSLKLGKDRMLFLAVSDDADMASIFLSALTAGVPVILADPETKPPRARAIIERSQPACIIADKGSLEKWEISTRENCTVIPYVKKEASKPGLLSKFLQKSKTESPENDFKSLLDKCSTSTELSSPSDDTTAYIIYTSGTTSDSKGVVITHNNLSNHLDTLKKVYSLQPESTILNQLLLAHADGCIQGPVLTAAAGCTWHRPSRFAIEKIPALLDYCFAENISHAIMVPAMLNMLVQFAEGYEDSFTYPEFKALISVSAHLDPTLWNNFESTFKVYVNNVYGLTETVAGSLFCGPLAGTYKKNTVGKPVDCEIKIVDTEGNIAADGETGELLLKGSHIMRSYFNDPTLTEESFREGWFCTGDLASVDNEGFVTIRGRKKHLVISGGYNIQPEEVIECLLNHPAVSEAAALGLPDEVFGEKLVAAVVLKNDDETNAFQIAEHCRKNLDDKKVPHKIYILPSLPKGLAGKVQVNALKEQLMEEQEPKQQPNGEFESAVISIAAEAFQVPSSKLSIRDTSQTIAGWDSLAHLYFVTSLEEKFNVKFNTAEVITLNSIKKAVHLLHEKNA